MAKTPHDVFISYSSKDKAVGDAICAILERRGVRCWIAPRDVVPGDPWARSIIQAINGASVFVLIFTDSSNHSAQVEREVERAAGRELPIIPFRVENIAPNETLEYFISSPHWMDAISPPLEQHIERLAGVVKGLLEREPMTRTAPGIDPGLGATGPAPASTLPPAKVATRGWVPLAIGGAVVAAALIAWLATRNHPSVVPPPQPPPAPFAAAPAPATTAPTAVATAPSAPALAGAAPSTPAVQSVRPPAPAVAASTAPRRVEEAPARQAPQAVSAAPAPSGGGISIGSFSTTGQTGGTNSIGTTTTTTTNNYGAAP